MRHTHRMAREISAFIHLQFVSGNVEERRALHGVSVLLVVVRVDCAQRRQDNVLRVLWHRQTADSFAIDQQILQKNSH